MAETQNLFDDGKAYERLIGRWSRIAGEKFLDWLEPPQQLSGRMWRHPGGMRCATSGNEPG
jgi:hypothetical protein